MILVHELTFAALLGAFYIATIDFIIRPPRGGDTR